MTKLCYGHMEACIVYVVHSKLASFVPVSSSLSPSPGIMACLTF